MLNKNEKELKIKELEKRLWDAADQLRGNISSEEYMYVVIGILFLKQMSDTHEKSQNKIREKYKSNWADKINDIAYLRDAGCNFIIPEKATWNYISDYSTSVEIGQILDKAFEEIENFNDELLGIFDKNYSRDYLDQIKLGRVVSIFSNIDLSEYGEDIIGRTYEYFLGEFFIKQGQKGGEFYTPKSIVSLMVNIVNPIDGRLYDPCCGTGGMFVQARQHLLESNKSTDSLLIIGQEYQNKTWKLARINLLLQGFDNKMIKLGHESADTFTNDLHKDEKVDYILANPPFNVKKWGRESLEDDSRWKWGLPPANNGNYAWLSLMLDKLNDDGKAAIVLSNGSLTSSTKEEKNIRKSFLEQNLISAIIMLPDKLFYTTGIPACIWVFDKNKKNDEVLFIDASELGTLVDGSKKNKEISEQYINDLSKIYHDFSSSVRINEKGLAKSIPLKEIVEKDYSLLPGSYLELKENEKRSEQEINIDLKKNIDELTKFFDDSKNLENNLYDAIKKMKL